MASTSSIGVIASSSFPSFTTTKSPLKKYDVFISFRGEDTRDNFTSHLHDALCRKNMETFIDFRIHKGEEVWSQLVKAIKNSTLFLVIFSEGYASSTWCLNELVEIMECKKNDQENNNNVVVIPVFYKIDPSHVRKQTGSYQIAFSKYNKNKDLKLSVERIHKWKDALYQVANLSGFDSHGYRTETDLIEDIINVVLQKVNHQYTHEFRGLFIYDNNYTQIQSLLEIDSKEVRIVGIWGMGGIGKTTLATAVFQKIFSQYEGACFLEDVAEVSKRYGLNYIYNVLLSSLLKEDLHIDTPKVIPSIITRRLKNKKVLIVLDGVNTFELIENLVGAERDWLGAGSRVIVTTRDKHVLNKGVDEIHEVKEMNFQNSLHLFSLTAFDKSLPNRGYEELSKRVVVYAKGIPLALKVLGSFLRSKSENEWDNALTKLKKIPNAKILKVMRLSYDELDDKEKNIFLDIACFFKGHERGRVTQILNACGFFADIGIRNLSDKALITITSYDCIEMHDLIREMGWEIVREESIKHPGQRSRVWDLEDVCDVLANNKGTSAVEGILLDMTQLTYINLSSKAFKNMPNLRLLTFQALNGDWKTINSVYLPNGLDLLPNTLRYFEWDGYPLKSLPFNICPEKLVELSLPYSNMERLWHGVQDLPNLEKIDLRCSTRLMECPNLSRAPNLKFVGLRFCESLLHVDPSIWSLPKLDFLSVSGCTSLKSLCANTCSPSLRGLCASRCFNLQDFSIPLVLNDSSSTLPLFLSLSSSGLNELPPSISQMRNLIFFAFPISESLANLPENFAREIRLSDPRTEHDALMVLMKVLSSSGFQSLRRLVFEFCQRLSQLPENISLLSSLEYLRLYKCSIINLPESIKNLQRLTQLEFDECKLLRSIPSLPWSIRVLNAPNCESLETMTCSTSEEPSKIHECNFLFLLPNCINLDQHSYNTILKDAIVRIELSTMALEDDGKVCYFLPVRSNKVQDWFHYHSMQALFTIELPPYLLGFIFYMVLSQGQSCHIGYGGSFGCECYLESKKGERIKITSFFADEITMIDSYTSRKMKCDHVFVWYDVEFCKQIMKAIEKRKIMNDSYGWKFTFRFFARNLDGEEAVIKECGLRRICPSKDQIMVESGRCKSKRSREIHEFEANAVRQRVVEGCEYDEQEEIVHPRKKFKQCVFGTSSNIEVEETEELRCLLEKILHIGFEGDLM